MKTNDKMLILRDVLMMEAGRENSVTWINPGVVCVVREIKRIETKTGKTMFACLLGDSSGETEAKMSLFAAPRFREGDTIEIAGKGLRLTEWQGNKQISPGRETTFTVLQRGAAVAPPATKVQEAPEFGPGGEEEREETKLTPVLGQTVGMALKEALAMHWEARLAGGDGLAALAALGEASLWAAIHATASDIIRLSRMLEKGKLAPPVRERANPSPLPEMPEYRPEEREAYSAPPAVPSKPQAREDNTSDAILGVEDDIPF